MATHSIAWLMPTTRGRNQLEQASGMIPRRANTKPMRACSEARRTSIGRVIVAPTPTAGPLMAAITGLVRVEDPQRQFAAVVAGDRVRLAALAVVEGLTAAAEVGAGAESAAGAGDDHGVDVVVGVGAVEGLHQLAAHLPGPRVQAVGAVEGDREDAPIELVDDLLEAHVARQPRGLGPRNCRS